MSELSGLLPLFSNSELKDAYKGYIQGLIDNTHSIMDRSTDLNELLRYQGKAQILKQLKSLPEMIKNEVNDVR